MNLIILFVVLVVIFQQTLIVIGRAHPEVRSYWVGDGKWRITVRRNHVVADSYQLISPLSDPASKLKHLSVWFVGERSSDHGGPKKDWLTILSKRLFSPQLGLFMYSKATNYKVQINPYSGDRRRNHLSLFRFAGIITGLAVHYNCQLVVSFTIPFLKSILSQPIELEDIKEADPALYSALTTIMKEDPKKLGFTFTVQDTKNGRSITRYLPPYKTKVLVTKKNRQEYQKSMLRWTFTTRIKPQLDAFRDGLSKFVSLDSLRRLSAQRLNLRISGRQIIDVKDWKANTKYSSCNANHPTVKLFWKMIDQASNEYRARVLQFATGSSRVPGGGFKALTSHDNEPTPFEIRISDDNLAFVPAGNTCYNRIDIPAYKSLAVLEHKFQVALKIGETAGFGFS